MLSESVNFEIENEGDTIITLPMIDIITDENSNANVTELQDFFIGQLPDGTYCLFNNTNELSEVAVTGNVLLSINEPLSNTETVNSSAQNVEEKTQKSLQLGRKISSTKKFSNGYTNNGKQISPSHVMKDVQPKAKNEKFKCLKCAKEFIELSELQYHLKWHKSQKKFKCSQCNAGYKIERNLELHIAIAHSAENVMKCPVCHVSFSSQRLASLKSHLMVHQIEETYTCEKCKSEFDLEDDFLKHMMTHSVENSSTKPNSIPPLSCHYCKQQYKNSRDLQRHISSHVKAKRYFQSKRPKFKEGVSKEKKFICTMCSKAFLKKSLLERHNRIHSGERPFKCLLCDRSFSQKSTLNVHLTMHAGIRPFACTLCPAKFVQKGNLRVHIQKTHTVRNEQTDKLFRCTHCTCVFKKISSLNAHVSRIHVNEKNPSDIDSILKNLLELEKIISNGDKIESVGTIESSHCETPIQDEMESRTIEFSEDGLRKMVTLSEVLNDGSVRRYLVRVKLVDETRLFLCNYCSKEFKKPSDLIRHIRIHTKEKPYKCNFCNATFSLKSTLVTHLNSHRSDRPFKCNMCNRTFNSLRMLNNHIWKHDEMITTPAFQCITCGFLCQTEEVGVKHKNHMGKEKGEHIIEIFDSAAKMDEINFGGAKTDKDMTSSPSTFTCRICQQSFPKKIYLFRHMNCHTKDKKYSCKICPRMFSTLQKLKDHSINCTEKNLPEEHIEINDNYECPVCKERYRNAELLKDHLIQKHGVNIENEDIVDNYSTESSLLQVLQNVEVTKADDCYSKENNSQNIIVPYVTTPLKGLHILNLDEYVENNLQKYFVTFENTIETKTTNITSSNEEEISNVERKIREDVTSKKQNSNDDSTEVINVVSKNSKIRPNIMRKSTVDKPRAAIPNIAVDVHESASESISENTVLTRLSMSSPNSLTTKKIPYLNYTDNFSKEAGIVCMTCDSIITAEEHVCNIRNEKHSEHNKKNHGATEDYISNGASVKKYRSKNISPGTTSVESNKNSKDVQENEQKKFIECHLCKRNFVDRIDYKNHLRTHSKIHRYECSICKKIFPGRMSYMKHLNTVHSDESGCFRPCKYCSKRFKKPSDLVRHLRVHTGERPFSCEVCKRNFSLKSTLESHMRTHKPKVRPFNCQICDLNFSTKATLKVHQTLHTGAKPFKCALCDMTFRTPSNRKSHIIVTHMSKRKKHSESKKEKIRKMLESVASSIISDTGTNPNTSQKSFLSLEVPGSQQSTKSLEGTLTDVNSIKDSVENEDLAESHNVTLPNNLVAFSYSLPNSLPTITSHTTIAVNSPVEQKSHNNYALTGNFERIDDLMVITNPIIASNPGTSTTPIVNSDSLSPNNSLSNFHPLARSVSTDESITADLLLNSEIVTNESTLQSEQNDTTSMTVESFTIDAMSLLQQLQTSSVIVSTNNDDESMPLIIDDIAFLNIDPSGENMQIISLTELDSSAFPTQHILESPVNTSEKPDKARTHSCKLCSKAYSSKDVLRRHVKTVHSKNVYHCSKCSLKFDQKQQLDTHMQFHNIIVDEQESTAFLSRTDHQNVNQPSYDLLTENIGDTLFANLFSVKKI